MGYHLADKGTAFQDFHLVVEVVAHGESAQALHGLEGSSGSSHAALAGVVFLDEYGGGYVVHGCLIAQVREGEDEADEDACHKPGPVSKVFKEDGIQVDALFVLLFVVQILFFCHDVCCIWLYSGNQLDWCEDDHRNRKCCVDNRKADELIKLLHEYFDELDDAVYGFRYAYNEYCKCRAYL